jgi:DNA invertase Pin-like site-specific DNA recombinase
VKPGDIIIAVELDRTFRDVADAPNSLKRFKKQGIGHFFRDLGGDVTRDAVSELVFGLLSSVAAFERQRIAERIVEVKADQRARARCLGGDVPFGHRLVEADGERYVEPDHGTLAVVRDLHSKGYSTRLIAGHFAARARGQRLASVPKRLEPLRRQLGIAHRELDILVREVVL